MVQKSEEGKAREQFDIALGMTIMADTIS